MESLERAYLDVVRLQDMMAWCKCNDIIFLGLMYDNQITMSNFYSGLMWKVKK
jgi:hypothetical protein